MIHLTKHLTIQLRLLKHHKIYQSSAKNVGEIVDIDVTSQVSQDSSGSSDKNFEMDEHTASSQSNMSYDRETV